MRVLAMDSGDHALAGVCLPLLLITTDRTALIDTCHMHASPAGTVSSHAASGNAMMPWPPMATLALAAPSVCVSSHSLSLPSVTLQHLVTSRPSMDRHYLASLRKCGVWVCLRATQFHIHIGTV